MVAASKKTGLIIGAVAVVAAIGVGVYFVIGGGGGSGSGGGGGIADDGAHKLVAQSTVLGGEYKKSGKSESNTMTGDDVKDAASWGVKDAKDVSASYTAGSGFTTKNLMFSGVYGTIDDPEKAVDAMFAKSKENSEKESSSSSSGSDTKLVGSPEVVKPAGFSNGIMKCQYAETTGSGKSNKIPICIWGDHSTITYVVSYDLASMTTGKSTTIDEAAALAAKLRQDVRVKA